MTSRWFEKKSLFLFFNKKYSRIIFSFLLMSSKASSAGDSKRLDVAIEFTNSSKLIVMSDGYKENKSKEIKKESDLWRYATKIREALLKHAEEKKLKVFQTRPLHVELSHRLVSEEIMAERAKLLEYRTVNLLDPESWYFQGRAIALRLPALRDYDTTHVTMVCFEDLNVMTTEEMRKLVLDALK
jgi:hypothetical protein